MHRASQHRGCCGAVEERLLVGYSPCPGCLVLQDFPERNGLFDMQERTKLAAESAAEALLRGSELEWYTEVDIVVLLC